MHKTILPMKNKGSKSCINLIENEHVADTMKNISVQQAIPLNKIGFHIIDYKLKLLYKEYLQQNRKSTSPRLGDLVLHHKNE